MHEMLEAIQAEVIEDPRTTEVEPFIKLLKASEQPLHEHITDPPCFQHPADGH
jgi:hypothetical protein